MSDSEHDWLRPEEEHETETVIDAGTAQSNPEVADYKREDYQIERLHRIAVDAGLDPDIAEMYREFVVTEAKRRHKRIAENGVDPGVLDVFA